MASTERKSTYPPAAESDQDVQPAGTGMDMLTKPGKPLPGPTYKYHASEDAGVENCRPCPAVMRERHHHFKIHNIHRRK